MDWFGGLTKKFFGFVEAPFWTSFGSLRVDFMILELFDFFFFWWGKDDIIPFGLLYIPFRVYLGLFVLGFYLENLNFTEMQALFGSPGRLGCFCEWLAGFQEIP